MQNNGVILYYRNEDGTTNPLAMESGTLTTRSYLQAVAEGDIPNHILFEKIGYGPAATASTTTLWNVGTDYVFPTTNISVEAVSTSANDLAVTGSGARTIHLAYLNSSYVEKTFTFNMNGVTPVAGPTDFFRVNTFHIETAGGTGRCAGVVSLRLVGGAATVYGQMAVGNARSRNSTYTVPLGKTVYIHDIMFSSAYSTAGKSERMTLLTSISPDGTNSTSGTIFWPHYEAMLVDNSVQKVDGAPIICPEKTDIKVNIIGETNAQSTCSYGGWME